jgi:hypothetical protein
MCFSIVNPTKFSYFLEIFANFWISQNWKKIKPWLVAPQKGKESFLQKLTGDADSNILKWKVKWNEVTYKEHGTYIAFT